MFSVDDLRERFGENGSTVSDDDAMKWLKEKCDEQIPTYTSRGNRAFIFRSGLLCVRAELISELREPDPDSDHPDESLVAMAVEAIELDTEEEADEICVNAWVNFFAIQARAADAVPENPEWN